MVVAAAAADVVVDDVVDAHVVASDAHVGDATDDADAAASTTATATLLLRFSCF